MSGGKGYLVGAGPGDPGLITVRGMECLRGAEVVLYDDLSHPDLVEEVPADCERIYVGKRAGFKAKSQEETNDLLVDRVRNGKRAVRLKGGDPYVFGRGGEEAIALMEAGLDFEVVPGVTSGFAAPAYAGIPVTHRGVSPQVTLVTGHEDPTKPNTQVDWEALGKAGGTLVVYMGVRKRELYAKRLMAGGLKACTPVAAIQWGTRPEQRIARGTLGALHELDIANPAAIVIGDVAGMQLEWFSSRPLAGETVVVTRTRSQSSDLVRLLRESGAEVLEVPTIEIVDPASWTEVDSAIDQISEYAWLVFASPNSVDRFLGRLVDRKGDIRALGTIRIAAVGPATADRVASFGVCVERVPDDHRAEGLAEDLLGVLEAGERVLYPRAEAGRNIVPDALRDAGYDVRDCVVYRTVRPDSVPQVVLDRLREDKVTLTTFTSSSTVKHFAELMDSASLSDRNVKIPAASIGPMTSETAKALGFTVVAEASPDDISVSGLVEAIRAYVNEK
ncbi:MAG: uroporphyrinogen-III C-methyltransferase [Gemmatimonadetes bacterium]|nr:uroporphyrinogen-III C-methyltransferase [Gemmatimonadota bacterium]